MPETLREQLSEQVEALETAQETTQAPESATTGDSAVTESASPAPTTPGRTAGRARDEHGRLLPGKAQREPAAQPETAAQPQVAAAPSTAPALAEPAKPKVNRPSSWKKDHWESFDKLATENPSLAEYINQREAEFAKGVSAYKSAYDTAKPLLEAIQPFQQMAQQHGADINKLVPSLLGGHQRLLFGSPQEKAAMGLQLIRDYGLPFELMFVKGQDGNVYLNPNLQAPAQQRQQPAQQPDIDKLVDEKLASREMGREIAAMSANTEKYPHFETVRETMAGLLQSGLASDLAEAYDAALRHPRHADIYDAIQKQEREAEAQRAVEEKRKQAEAARRNQISPKSAPSTGAGAGATGKGLRGTLSEAFDAHAPSRV